MKPPLVLCLLMLVLSVAYAQTRPIAHFSCADGWCMAREVDIERLVQYVDMMNKRILELQAKTGCT